MATKLERHQEAYRGYLITRNIHSGEYYVSKDAHHIATYLTPESAKKGIDFLLD
jgi:hypothetical protein